MTPAPVISHPSLGHLVHATLRHPGRPRGKVDLTSQRVPCIEDATEFQRHGVKRTALHLHLQILTSLPTHNPKTAHHAAPISQETTVSHLFLPAKNSQRPRRLPPKAVPTPSQPAITRTRTSVFPLTQTTSTRRCRQGERTTGEVREDEGG